MSNPFYTIAFTDTTKTPFIVNPDVSDGPVVPSSSALRPDAVSANTTLALLGRGYFDYGQPVWQDMVYMLEHFANTTAPSYPIQGQIWYDSGAHRSKVYNGTSWDTLSLQVAGNIDAGGNRIINVANAINPTDAVNVQFGDARYLMLAGGAVTGATTFASTVGVSGVATFGSNVILTGAAQLTLPNVPVATTDGANKDYVDSSIITGNATLLAQAATAAAALYIAKAGDTVPGLLTLMNTGGINSAGPVSISDTLTTTGTAAIVGPLNVTGMSTFSNVLHIDSSSIQLDGTATFNANNNFIQNVPMPLLGTDAVNKAYVDAAVAGAGGGGSNLTAVDYDASTGTITLHIAASPDIIMSGNVAPFVHTQDASTVNLNVNPTAYVGSYLREQAVNTPTFATTGEIPLDIALQYVDQYLYQLNRGRTRQVYTVTGTEAVPGTYTLTNGYMVDSNRLAVYLDGIKQIASFHARGQFQFFPGIEIASDSGLAPSTTYAFNLTVDATLYSNVSITTSAAPVITINEATNLLNVAVAAVAAPAAVIFATNTISIGAASAGVGSIVTITSPTAGVDLTTSFANMGAIINSTIAHSWAFTEVGLPGSLSTTITFNTIPAAGQVLEFINEPA